MECYKCNGTGIMRDTWGIKGCIICKETGFLNETIKTSKKNK